MSSDLFIPVLGLSEGHMVMKGERGLGMAGYFEISCLGKREE